MFCIILRQNCLAPKIQEIGLHIEYGVHTTGNRGGSGRHAALQSHVSPGELSDEILRLPRYVFSYFCCLFFLLHRVVTVFISLILCHIVIVK